MAFKFQGCCTYPHGGYVILGLFLSSLGATGCLWYAFANCRFVVLQFESSLGGFGQIFSTNGAGNTVVEYQIGAGLFSWLQPYVRDDNVVVWNDGRCTGYTRRQTDDGFSDTTFEVVRVMAVVSVILSVVILIWIILLGCLSMGTCYIRLLSSVLMLVTTTTALCFLVLESGLCRSVGDNTRCSLDEGGLVAIASVILWFVTYLISVLFVVPLGKDLILVDGELRSDFAERQALRKRIMEARRLKALEHKRQREEEAVLRKEQQQKRKDMLTPTKVDQQRQADRQDLGTPGTLATMEGDDGDMEVYIQRRLDNIEALTYNDENGMSEI